MAPINNHPQGSALLSQLRTVADELEQLTALVQGNGHLPPLIEAKLLIDADKLAGKLSKHRRQVQDAQASGTRKG